MDKYIVINHPSPSSEEEHQGPVTKSVTTSLSPQHFYVTQMSLYIVDDSISCQVFTTSLKEETLSWFT